ncbi:MAG: transglutaminase TgpA family protein, partial [Leucothrix sp.]
YGILSMIILTGALIANQQSPAQQLSLKSTRSSLKISSAMLLQCLPLMVIVFIFMPRFSPLWSIPSFESHAKTGITDSMAPGDIANLSKSDELAFRATFKGRIPRSDELYWRGLVLNHFDGKSWQQLSEDYDVSELKSQLQYNMAWNDARVDVTGEPFEYEAIYEKTGQPWLFTLTPTTEADGSTIKFGDYRVMSRGDIQSPLMVKAVSYPDSKRDLNLTDYARSLALQLPAEGDEKTRSFAKQLRENSKSDAHYVEKVLERFTEQSYFYTLRPPLLGDNDTIDKFLFETQRGFCSHYSGSFVYMMRAAGVPARIVVGYLGGKWNNTGDYLAVRQYDAHAWAEVWLEGEGWRRVDPTSKVAPSRVEGGLEAAVEYEGSFLEDSPFSAQNFKWLDGIREKMDAMQYGWRRWVLGYDDESQADLLKTVLAKISAVPLAALIGALFLGVFLLWFVMLGLARQQVYEAYEHRLYRKFCKRLSKYGLIREPQQTPHEFAMIASKRFPEKADVILELSALYQELCFVPDGDANSKDKLKRMRQLLRQLKPRNTGYRQQSLPAS